MQAKALAAVAMKGIIAMVLVGLFASQAIAVTNLTDVNVLNKPDRVVISVQGSAPLSMTMLSSKSGHYLGFQFRGSLLTKGRLVGIRSGRIANVKYSRFSENPPVARFVVNTFAQLDYSTEWNDDKTQVEISVWKFGAGPVAQVPASRPAIAKLTPLAVSEALPVLPPIAIRGPQGSDPGIPAEAAKPVAVAPKHKAAPVTIARIAPPATAAFTFASSVPAASGAGKLVSLNFLGAEISDVLKALAVQSGENIVASKDVKGEITVSLSDVTLEQALDYVAKLSGFSYTKQNGTYLVAAKESIRTMTSDTLGTPPTEVIPVKYANSDDVIALIKAQYPDLQATKIGMREANKSAATTKGPEPQSCIVLSGPAASIAGAKLLVQQVDIPGENDQVVYKVKYVAADLLAATLRELVPDVTVEGLGITSTTSGQSGGAAGATGAAATSGGGAASANTGSQGTTATSVSVEALDNLSRTLVLTGRKGDVEKASTLIKALDVRSPQIKIEAKITSISENGGKTLGLTWDWGALNFTESVEVVEGQPDRATNRYYRDPLSFGATLDALVTSGNATLLASPNLLCLEGKPGTFFAGDEVTYVSSVSSSSSGEKTYQTSTVKAGVTLIVVGSVSSDGYITLVLHPEVSTYSLSTEGNVTVPTVSSRYTDNVVRVKSGTTIAIGGLIRSDEIKSMSKIPLLGDLPFFGNLFRHVHNTSTKTEVVMFITASIVKDQE